MIRSRTRNRTLAAALLHATAAFTIAACDSPANEAPRTDAAPAPIRAGAEQWRTEESNLLTEHVQLTSRDMFVKAGEAYFDHHQPPRWVIFQAVKVPPEGEEPLPYYSMFVAKLKWQGEGASARIAGIDDPIQVSPEGSANTCGWFHPREPWRVLFGSTMKTPTASERSGFQVGSRKYVWQFPEEMEIVHTDVFDILKSESKGTDRWDHVQAYERLQQEYPPKIRAALQAGNDAEATRLTEELYRREIKEAPEVAALHARHSSVAWDAPLPVFQRPQYDAECSWSYDYRYVLYAGIREPAPDDTPGARPDADIFVYDTQTKKHVPLITADGYDGGPFFSPDGNNICYRSDRRGDDHLQLFIARLKLDDTGAITGISEEKQITDNAHVNWAPFWHPSGRFLVYATSEVGHHNYEVFAIEVDWQKSATELRRRRITTAPGADILPSFSDDGKWMMWTAQRGPMIDGESKPSSQVWIARFNEFAAGEDCFLSVSPGKVDEPTVRSRMLCFLKGEEARWLHALRAGGGNGGSDYSRIKFEPVEGGWRATGINANVPCGEDWAYLLEDGRAFSISGAWPPDGLKLPEPLSTKVEKGNR